MKEQKQEVLIRTAEEFRAFAITAGPGEVARYHRGVLANDRERELQLEEDKRLNRLADTAMNLAEIGFFHLTQRRDGDVFCYLATRTRKVWILGPEAVPRIEQPELA